MTARLDPKQKAMVKAVALLQVSLACVGRATTRKPSGWKDSAANAYAPQRRPAPMGASGHWHMHTHLSANVHPLLQRDGRLSDDDVPDLGLPKVSHELAD